MPLRQVLLDSSAVLCLLNRREGQHEAVKEAFAGLLAARAQVFTTTYLRAETHALLGARLSWEAARRWLLSPGRPIIRVLPEDEDAAVEIIRAHSDKGYSFTDATSFAIMNRLGVDTALTVDRHFRQFGFQALPN